MNNKSADKNQQDKLKNGCKQSHNSDSQLIALVKFLARLAAEEDYKNLTTSQNSSEIKGG